jgi:hypothetical protein
MKQEDSIAQELLALLRFGEAIAPDLFRIDKPTNGAFQLAFVGKCRAAIADFADPESLLEHGLSILLGELVILARGLQMPWSLNRLGAQCVAIVGDRCVTHPEPAIAMLRAFLLALEGQPNANKVTRDRVTIG